MKCRLLLLGVVLLLLTDCAHLPPIRIPLFRLAVVEQDTSRVKSALMASYPDAIDEDEMDQPPIRISPGDVLKFEVGYPSPEAIHTLRGMIRVFFVVDEKGDVIDAGVAQGIDSELDGAVVRVVRESKYEPGLHNGRPTKALMSVTFRFGSL